MQKQVILALDDNPANLDILVELLTEYSILACTSAQQALGLLKKHSVDLILLDIMMPKINGLDVARIIKADSEINEIPILFISANDNEDLIEEGFDIGAVDYVLKPFRPKELLARVSTHLKMSKMYKDIKKLAYYDTLSGARNRRSFFEIAKTYIDKKNHNRLFAVMIDIDKFKNINDTYGHGVGDKVIKSLSDIFHQNLDENMLFARLGGEEFALLIQDSDKDFVLKFMESMRTKIESHTLEVETMCVKYQISCGVSVFDENMKNIDELMNKADEALYDAKNTGRNKVKFRL